jgi:hypothetical protein
MSSAERSPLTRLTSLSRLSRLGPASLLIALAAALLLVFTLVFLIALAKVLGERILGYHRLGWKWKCLRAQTSTPSHTHRPVKIIPV